MSAAPFCAFTVAARPGPSTKLLFWHAGIHPCESTFSVDRVENHKEESLVECASYNVMKFGPYDIVVFVGNFAVSTEVD